MSSGDGIHWPSVARAAAGFLGVMAVGWTLALATGWDWLGIVAMVPAAACGYWWANGHERRTGVVPHRTEQEMSERASRILLPLIAVGTVTALAQREWYLVALGLVAFGPVSRARAIARRGARGATR